MLDSVRSTRRKLLAAAGAVAAAGLVRNDFARAAPAAGGGTGSAGAGGPAGATGRTGDPADTAYRTARELVALLQAREVSSAELVERAITRIEAHDGALNAVVVRDFARARAAAAQADEALARGERRPLLGVPMTVKESFNVAGLPTTWGIPGTQRLPVAEDAVAVARLKAAGAVILGKTNVPLMLLDWQAYNAVYGVTNNPWDPSRTPGGSSGGSAAALAAGFVPLEFGSDIAGSLRAPASYCGVFAHKPTHDLVPMRGHVPPGSPGLSLNPPIDLAVVGPTARSAADLALALDVVAGPDDADAVAYRLVLPPPRRKDLKSFRVLVLDQHPLLPTAATVRAALDKVAGGLTKLGTKVERGSLLVPDLARIGGLYSQLLLAFVGADLPPDVYQSMQAAAAPLSSDDESLSASRLRGAVMSHRDWIATDRMRVGVAHQWRQVFREWDVVLSPVMPTEAFAHDHSEMRTRRISVDGKEIPYQDQSMWISIATLAGLPATAMPIGLGDHGLPVGMQIIGPYLEDRTTIAFAEFLEREFGGFVAPPSLG
jgi:amidase